MNEEITLEAGLAFGTGEHPSTLGALYAMRQLAATGFCPKTILDIGTGSGILLLYAAHLWPEARLFGTEINPAALETARHNLASNHIAAQLYRADGANHAAIAAASPYQLILCNILAEPIHRLSGDMASILAEGGRAILSGILMWRAPQLLEAYALHNLTPESTLAIHEWRSLVMHKK